MRILDKITRCELPVMEKAGMINDEVVKEWY